MEKQIGAQTVLKRIEAQSKKLFLPIIGPRKGEVLTTVIRRKKPRRVLEIGTLIGYSAILMGKDMSTNSQIISIEIHPDEAKEAEENIRQAHIPPEVQVLVGDAKQVIPKLDGEFEVFFIDAEKTEYLQYLRLAEPKMKRGSVVVADNAGIFADQMRDYLEYVRSSGKYQSRYYQFGEDGVEVSEKT